MSVLNAIVTAWGSTGQPSDLSVPSTAGDKKYIMGPKLSTLDATVFAFPPSPPAPPFRGMSPLSDRKINFLLSAVKHNDKE